MSEQAANQAIDIANFDIRKILSFLPHRYPFLLVDRVVELEIGKSIKAYKNVTFNEPFFQGHFPGLPIFPGVLIMEALAQAGGLLVLTSVSPEEAASTMCLFTGMEGVRFRKQVIPGDRLELHGELLRKKMRICKMGCQALVNGQVVAEAELMAALMPRGDL